MNAYTKFPQMLQSSVTQLPYFIPNNWKRTLIAKFEIM